MCHAKSLYGFYNGYKNESALTGCTAQRQFDRQFNHLIV